MRRYTRHSGIPGWNQERLASSSAVVIGMGALGSEVARMLAQSGVGHLVLCDGDTVSESNLNRGSLYGATDVGMAKVDAAAAHLSAINPGVHVDPRPTWSSCGVGLSELRDADAVLSCLDSRAARVELARRCNLAGAAMLDGGTWPWGGEVRLYTPDGACYGCALDDAGRAESDEAVRCGAPQNGAASAASAPVSALIGSLMSATAIRMLLDLPVRPGVVSVDATLLSSHRVRAERDPACPLHLTIPAKAVERSPYSSDALVRLLLARLEPGETVLTWADFPSPDDAAARLIQLRDAAPDQRLRDLGVAPGEILTVVREGRPDRYIELARGGRR
ncbi:adenylyltransferase and sulfurtransferase [Sinosporangium album]|uniref:Adenylyltransferase and sulfurtransferase n=1 Tax=Sinosporangium album TaxID=504805 RepID=A0A1G7X3S5_9ACTN|nr:ThiF family adenylyltransferase [Sinosporangium album]SDG78824.1 adenylyltransferase and sulfurtransferase [Sinosporangium album]